MNPNSRGQRPSLLGKISRHLGLKPIQKLSMGIRWGWIPLAIALSSQTAKPSHAAERITVSLGATIERSISVDALEIYVEEGRITEELAPYIPYIERLGPDALTQMRELLQQRADINVTTLAQFAYTPQGEYLLEQAGQVFRTGARLSGGKGLRGAAIGAAADRETGLTLLNVIRRFPTPVLRVDLRQGLAFANQATKAFEEANLALELVEQIAFQTAAEPFPKNLSAAVLNRLVTQPGPLSVRQTTLRLKASIEPVDVYIPQRARGVGIFPAVIISHGLGNERETYTYLSNFLATHGFAVINVEHPGSSADQFDALVSGSSQGVPDEEFTNRPRLISEVLDELDRRANTDKSLASIDFDNVGILGQSFGGYTALAVAGAPLNSSLLRDRCPPEFSPNLSVLLQCQAVELATAENAETDFLNPRIQAVVAINPMTSVIFGEESLAQIKVPVMIMAGSGDTIAPALPEQVRPFTWLTTPHRYLLMMARGTHFSTLGITGNETFQLPPEIFGPVPEVAQRYTKAMSLAFFNLYLKNDLRYQNVLTSAFTTRFSDPDMPLSLILDLTAEQLNAQLQAAAETNDDGVEPSLQTVLETVIEMEAPGQQTQARLKKQATSQTTSQATPSQTTPSQTIPLQATEQGQPSP